ncbi:MAG: hypothetical protein ACO25F_02220 [Erythrobacter sp.]
MKPNQYLVSVLALTLAACSGNDAGADAPAGEVAAIPESLAPFGDGYPTAGAPCRQLGESAATSNYLDDSAVLVGCPSDETAAMLGGKVVGNVEGVRLVSVPMGDANVGMAAVAPADEPAVPSQSRPKARDVAIRGANGLEGRCARKIANEVGARVIGTNRIEESEAAIAIYVNVEGAQAPWRCLAYRDGTIGEIMYTGSEGAL